MVLIIDLNAHSHSDSALYPDSGFLSDSGLSLNVLTVVFIPTLVYILTVVSSLSDYSPQHSPHSYFHVIIICSYPAVRVKKFAYVNMLGRNDLILTFAGKDSSHCKPATTHRESRNNANDSFGKGFRVLKYHVLNRLMTGRCPSKYCSYSRKLRFSKKCYI